MSYDYGTPAGVARYVRHLCNTAGVFDTATRPTLADVEAFLEERSNQLNAWLAQAGYVVPVTAARAASVLGRYASLGAACDCELTPRSAGYSEDENRRENKFCAQFLEAEAYIKSGALSALGATTTAAPAVLSGLRVGGRTATGQRLRPVFGRTGFNNDPTAESPTAEGAWDE